MQRYSKLMIGIHWATALLILVAWFTAVGGREVRSDPSLIHFACGLAVLLLVVPRLLARWLGRASRVDNLQGRLWDVAARMGHIVLYLFLIGLPLSGWYAASRMGMTVSFLGFELPALTAPVEGYPGLIAELHETGGTAILILAGLHALIALWHQFVLRDGTLGRMSPL
jgi:superoxide oxidase